MPRENRPNQGEERLLQWKFFKKKIGKGNTRKWKNLPYSKINILKIFIILKAIYKLSPHKNPYDILQRIRKKILNVYENAYDLKEQSNLLQNDIEKYNNTRSQIKLQRYGSKSSMVLV